MQGNISRGSEPTYQLGFTEGKQFGMHALLDDQPLLNHSSDYMQKGKLRPHSSMYGSITSSSCAQRGFTICESGELPSGLSRCDVATMNRRPLTLSPALRMLHFRYGNPMLRRTREEPGRNVLPHQ